ncbi:vitamin K epoxide reductase family protein [Runella zeae]|uniref:vitamin K epoxide reductase family protein n=1 Tax=Runella zeae TaxID=94255 RepID=UPI000414FB83|nr:vitamin K epoxide reductase family protein [Runella zeae]
MKLNFSEKNAIDALTYIVETTGVKVTAKSVKEQLFLHPDFPSILSFSDTLHEWKIPNVAARVFREQLVEIPLPAVAYLEIKGGCFAPIRNVTATEIEWLDTQKGWQKEPLEDFYRKWNHVVLLLEPNENSQEAKYNEKRKEAFLTNIRTPFVIGGLIVCALLGGGTNVTTLARQEWQFLALLVTKLLGVGVSSLLLLSTLGTDSSLLRSICGFDSRTDCNNVLSSKAAKLWGWLGWADIGFVYFAGGLVYLLTCPLSLLGGDSNEGTNYLLPLWGLGGLALPYTIWSVWYQWRVAKTWCTLCLIVQVLIWVEFYLTPAPLLSREGLIMEPRVIASLIFSFLLPTVLLVFIKKPLQDATQVWPLRRELQKAKFNPEYVESLFAKQPQMPPIFEDMRVVKIGNPEAEHTLTIVTNPMCGPCVRLHPEIEDFIENTDMVNCQFVFLGSANAQPLVQTIISLPNERAVEAMHRWYAGKYRDVETWSKDVNADAPNAEVNQQIQLHRQWCDLAEIQATPTLYLNGRQMPLAYHLSDVENLCRILAPEMAS